MPEAPLFLAMIRALEATPTPMSLGEVYLSLQTGVADGQENPVGTINDQKFYEVQKYLNLTGHVIVPILIMMNKKAYDAMTPADQQAIRAAFTEGAKVNDELTRANEARLTDFFKTKGVTIVNSDRESFRKKMTLGDRGGREGHGLAEGHLRPDAGHPVVGVRRAAGRTVTLAAPPAHVTATSTGPRGIRLP